MKTVCCVGQSVYDITYPIYEDIIENRKYSVNDKIECIGGPATNAAYLNAKWGNETYIISRVGNDLYGQKIISELKNIGVNTKFMKCCNKETSISSVISNLSNGKRTIFNSPSNKENINFEYPDKVDIILVDGHELEASLKILDLFPDAKSLIDAGTYRSYLEELISKVDYLICSEYFVKQYTGIEIDYNDNQCVNLIFEKLEKLNSKQIIVTIGEKGLLYKRNEVITHMEAFKCKPLDTTGAGDIFHGAFAYCLSKDYILEESLKISSMASALSVEIIGGQTSIPKRQEVIERIDEFPYY